MAYAEQLALILGLIMVAASYTRYWQRTRDTRGLLIFWRKELALSRDEFRWQRAGIALLLLAVVLRFFAALI